MRARRVRLEGMRRTVQLWLMAGVPCAALFGAAAAHAGGTAAGTVISNNATVVYTLKGSNYTQQSNTDTFAVDDKVSFTLTAVDTGSVSVTPGGRTYLTYLLTNTGNGEHDFTLQAAISATSTLNPAAAPRFFADSAGNTPLPTDANAGGLPYVSALSPDATAMVHLFLTAPAQATDGQFASYIITAEAYQPGNLGVIQPPVKSSAKAAADASASKNANMMTRYVVLADGHGSGGDADRDGRYAVNAKDAGGKAIGFTAQSSTVNVVKSAAVTDRFGGTEPISGATIHYTLQVSATGTGTALGVVITDPVPANTTYLPGTLTLNGKALSDALDGDAGDVGGTAAGTVTVKVGDVGSATPVQTIGFDVKIN